MVVINNLKNKHARTFRKVSKAFGAEPSFEDYILGGADGKFNPSEDKTLWIVRRDKDAPEEYVPWLGLSPFPVEAGKGLIIGWFDGQRGIYAPSVKQMVAAGGNPNTGNTGDTRIHGWFSKEGYPGLICKAIGTLNTPSTLILVEDHEWIDDDHTFRVFKRSQADLASYIPGSGLQRLVLVCVMPDNSIHIVSGVTRSTGLSIFPSHVQAVVAVKPPRSIPVALFKLANGQTRITDADRIKDMRELVNTQIPPRHNWSAVVDPIITDDSDSGYGIGSVWVNTGSPQSFICVDDTPGAAVWQATGGTSVTIDTDPTLAANSDAVVPSQKAIKSYVDALAQGLSIKYSVLAATTTTLPANTYSNGVSGAGATITANANGALTIDGQAIALNDRVLIKDESSASHNGIYQCTTAGSGGAAFVLTRVTDMDSATEIPGAFTFVENGTVNDGAGFVVADPGPFTIGTTTIPWTQFSGAGQIVAGSGISKTGNTLAVDATVIRTTGTQSIGTGLTVDTPIIANFTNANHNHTNAAGGGQITDAALSAAVGIAKGGTGQITKAAAFDALAPSAVDGQLMYHTGAAWAALPVGGAGESLTGTGGQPAWNSQFPRNYAKDTLIHRVSNSEVIVGSTVLDDSSFSSLRIRKQANFLRDMATAAHWYGGATAEAASEWVHFYAAGLTTYLYNKAPNSVFVDGAVAVMQANQSGWNGTAANGLNATSVVCDNITGTPVAGNMAIIYASTDTDYSLGRGRGTGAAGSRQNVCTAMITGWNAGTSTLTLEAGHNIAINDNDRIRIVEYGPLTWRDDSGTLLRYLGSMYNDASSNLAADRLNNSASYQMNEASNYTIVNVTTFTAIDATNLTLSLVTEGGDVEVGFFGTASISAGVMRLNLEVDGLLVAADDGLTSLNVAGSVPFALPYLLRNLLPGTHTVRVMWRTNSGGGSATMYNGAGSTNLDIHPQFWAKEA